MPIVTLKNTSGSGPLIHVVFSASDLLADALREAGRPVPLAVVVPALLDTGAKHTMIDTAIAEELGIEPSGSMIVWTATTGEVGQLRDAFDVGFGWGAPIASPVSGCHRVIASNLGSRGVRALIGRDLLARCQLVYNGPQDEFTLSF
jgi:hypothetical protein